MLRLSRQMFKFFNMGELRQNRTSFGTLLNIIQAEFTSEDFLVARFFHLENLEFCENLEKVTKFILYAKGLRIVISLYICQVKKYSGIFLFAPSVFVSYGND